MCISVIIIGYKVVQKTLAIWQAPRIASNRTKDSQAKGGEISSFHGLLFVISSYFACVVSFLVGVMLLYLASSLGLCSALCWGCAFLYLFFCS